MQQISNVIRQMINISDTELDDFLCRTFTKTFSRQELLSRPGAIPNEIFFINKGIVRVIITDNDGIDHTLHFGLENQFIADYSCFLLKQSSFYSIQAVEETEVTILQRTAVEWGYQNLKEGNKLGRLIAEFYFVYQDDRIKNLYARTAKERYDSITDIFPDIHNRVPQHMIASYLGVTPVHLSRLKKQK
ncbi:Crp/Fnr family transcriptional regulator [Lacibacter sediminis]|uniref:Crp/Fnr family transcriptional regulator n=1 Tax=Lacibacter sediminis TaxID=2760713 RepID=A0A7G5XJF3_9BACT|nr:Crp/Fnr family transcriptional regulator [Lacibacter sediminis]QNA45606.1 Crp/Fnr family transcriptional regulator [Lacibacter sediminis]